MADGYEFKKSECKLELQELQDAARMVGEALREVTLQEGLLARQQLRDLLREVLGDSNG